ncbi:MAG: SulP family inorganic anion transporter, partial [Minicystis sp.]
MSLPPPSRPPSSRPPPSTEPPPPSGSLLARLFPELFAGSLSGVLLVLFALAFASLIFAGEKLGAHLSFGVGALLLSSAVLAAGVALRSSFKPAMAGPQDTTTALIALIAAEIAEGAHLPEDILPTIVAAFAITALATGVLFTALGVFGLGKIVRFVPYPVIGGILAGTGWLLVRGALVTLTGLPLRLGTVTGLFVSSALIRWLPALLFGAAMTAIVQRFRQAWLVPVLIVAGPVLFYAALGASGHSVEDAGAHGFLLGPFPAGVPWPALTPDAIHHVRWNLLFQNAGMMGALVLLTGISLLLKASSLELATDRDIELDAELRATGLANLVTGVLGVPLGHLSLGASTLGHELRARTRVPGVIAGVLCLVAFFFGQRVLAYFPRPVLGGMLFYLGFSLLFETVYATRLRLPRGEYVLVILILLVVVTLGFVEGVGLSIVISSVLFALNYAGISVVKHVISGAVLRSKAARGATSDALLQELGSQISVFKLQGYLFFGTAYNLLTRVQEQMSKADPLPVRYLVLDFRHVDGIDSSAVLSFAKMRKLCETQKVRLAFTELSLIARKQLERGGCIDDALPETQKLNPDDAPVVVFPDLDHGLEWCEEQVITNAESRPSTDVMTRELASMHRHQDLVAELSRYLERLELPADHPVFKEGESSGDLYLIESGEVAAQHLLDGVREKRLRTMGPGSVVGEAGLYL